MCLTQDVSFSRIPAKGWQAQKGRGWHHSLPLPTLHGIPHQTPVLGMTQIPQLMPGSSRAHCIFFPLISSSQVLLSHYVKEVLQTPVPKYVCSSQWHMPNCQLTGGHSTWGTVSFPRQMEFYWSRRRPTTGLLEQMLCRQSLGLSFSRRPLVPPSLTENELSSSEDFQAKKFSTNLVFEKQSPALQNLRNTASKTEICIIMEFE